MPDHALAFDEMAARIRKNPDEFQGAYLVVGPEGTTVSNALFGPKSNVALFWSTVKNHVSLEADVAAQAADAASRNTPYGRQR